MSDVGLGYTPMAHHLRCSKVEKFGRERDRQRVGWAGMKRDREASLRPFESLFTLMWTYVLKQ